MKVVWYLLTVLLGALGALSLLRAVELLMVGGELRSIVFQVVMAVLWLAVAWASLRKARTATARPTENDNPP